MAFLSALMHSPAFDKEIERLRAFVADVEEQLAETLRKVQSAAAVCETAPAAVCEMEPALPTPVAAPAGFVGTFLDGAGGAVQCWNNETKEPILFKAHGREIPFGAAQEALKNKLIQKDLVKNLIVDIIVATFNNGAEEVMGELLLQLSVAAVCWLPKHGMDVFSGLGVLYSSGTSEKAKGEMARRYGGAFESDVLKELLRGTAMALTRR